MIEQFTHVRISNLFSYYAPRDPVEFDLGGIDPHTPRNIIVIQGRNGFGKTSFLNSLKMLFDGASKELLREPLFHRASGPGLSERDYLLGYPGRWDGAFNARARHEGQTVFYVEADWIEPNGTCTARRTWTLTGRDHIQEKLVVQPASGPTRSDVQAEEFLRERLPPAYLPFYFFDSEEIGYHAEQMAGEQVDVMKQLLGIHRVDALINALGQVKRSLPLRARVNAKDAERRAMQGDLERNRAHLQKLSIAIQDLEREISEMREQLVATEQELARLSHYGSFVDPDSLDREIRQNRADIAELQRAISSEFLPLAPMIVNSILSRAAVSRLQSVLESSPASYERLLRQLREQIPAALTDEPRSNPPLTDAQIRFYKKRLLNRLEEHAHLSGGRGDETTFFATLSSHQVNSLVQRLSGWQASLAGDQWRGKLLQLAEKKQILSQKTRRQSELSSAPRDIRRQYETLVRQKAHLEAEIPIKERQLVDNKQQYPVKSMRVKELENELQQLDEELDRSRDLAAHGERAKQLEKFFGDYRKALFEAKRCELEARMNAHWRQLMTAHALIERTEIDEDFRLSYYDANGRRRGGANLSAGMKQLAAVALLWSLSEVSGSRAPVIVDTPLARIDREHQEKLLIHYYPVAAKQVIVLPTDSELNEEKLDYLKPYLRRFYRLNNPSGEGTIVTEVPLERLEERA